MSGQRFILHFTKCFSFYLENIIYWLHSLSAPYRSSSDNLLCTPSHSVQAPSYALLLFFSLPWQLYHLCFTTDKNISPYKEV